MSGYRVGMRTPRTVRRGFFVLAGVAALGGCAARQPGSTPTRAPAPDSSAPAKRGGSPEESTPRLGRDAEAADPLLAAPADRPRVESTGAVAPVKRVPVEEFRPAWWLTAAERASGRVRVSAMGEDVGLVEARLSALEAARDALRAELGTTPSSVETERYTVVQLPNGSYRAFVLVSGQER